MVKSYSVANLGKDYKVSEHFALSEFQCRDGSDTVLICEDLLKTLEAVRAWARDIIPGCVVVITSGYRTPKYNKAIKGALNSEHTRGKAADFKIRKPDGSFVKPSTIYAALETGGITGYRYIGGLGLYPTWVHIDTRSTIARW